MLPDSVSKPDTPETSRVTLDLDLAPGESISITVESFPAGAPLIGVETLLQGPSRIEPPPAPDVIPSRRVKLVAPHLPRNMAAQTNLRLFLANSAARLRGILPKRWPYSLDATIFGLVLITYLCTRFIGLTSFPIYFFTDEAVGTVLASDFVRDGLHNYDHDFMPTYFVNGSQYNLSTSVYLQIIPFLIFGKSEWATRGTAVLETLVGVIAVALILKNIFKKRYWWTAALLLSVTPAWFLHSRTAFETGLMVSLYAGFLYFYLSYRYRAPKYLYAALVMGGLTFYAYSPGQMVMLVTGVLLFFSDIRYHWQNRKTALIGAGVLVLVALPYVRFLVTRGAENFRHLEILNSYLTDNISLSAKVHIFFTQYLAGLNPAYWFLPNNVDLSRHLMKGYGHISLFVFPFMVLGVLIALWNWRSSAHRALLIAVLAAPSGAALVALGITRALVFVIPAAILSALGLVACLEWLERRRLPRFALATGVFILLAGFNFYMLRDALVNGPLWYSDYGLSGMQYGARQLFAVAADYHKQYPRVQLIISPAWANGTDVVARFFLPDDTTIQLGSIEGYYYEHKLLTDNMVFVMIPEEYQRMLATGKFTNIRIEKTLLYPNGAPGFYFIRLSYVDNIDAILAAEEAARQQLLSEKVTVSGRPATVRYSQLDIGPIQNIFDGNDNTLVRSLEANPIVIEVQFDQPQSLQGMTVLVGGTPTQLTANVSVVGKSDPVVFKNEVAEATYTRNVPLDFGGALMVTQIHLEVKSPYDGEPAHVHVWEVAVH
jgi:hypothetical protein